MSTGVSSFCAVINCAVNEYINVPDDTIVPLLNKHFVLGCMFVIVTKCWGNLIDGSHTF